MSNLDFDGQALAFDQRTGLPMAASSRVAKAVAELARPRLERSRLERPQFEQPQFEQPQSAKPGCVLDLGAGTGVVGMDLAGLVETYIGLDLSLPMLTVYRRKMVGSDRYLLIHGDGDRGWPVADGSVDLVFSSRAAHLLGLKHLVQELQRVARPEGAVLVLGSVRRDKKSVRDALRREMRRLLKAQGIDGKGGRKARRSIFDQLQERGAEALESRRPASWSVVERPADSLTSWRAKNGLAGQAVDAEVRRRVLDRVEAWARERWGDLSAAYPSTDYYELEAIRLPARDGESVAI